MEIFESFGVAVAALIAALTFIAQVYQNFLAKKAARASEFVQLHSKFLENEKQTRLIDNLAGNSSYRFRKNDLRQLEEILWFFERVAYLKAAGIIGVQEMNLFQPDLNLLANHKSVKAELDAPSYRGYFPSFRRLANWPDAGKSA